MKRHNLAVERLSKAREDWNRERQQRLDLINKTLSDQRHAEHTFRNLDDAMREYDKVIGQQLLPLRAEPKLADFHNFSRERKDAEIALVVGGMVVVGIVAFKFL